MNAADVVKVIGLVQFGPENIPCACFIKTISQSPEKQATTLISLPIDINNIYSTLYANCIALGEDG